MEENVGAHHGAHHRSHLEIDRAAVEDGVEPEAVCDEACEGEKEPEAFFVSERAAPEKVIEEPAADEGSEADDGSHVAGEIGFGRVEEEGGAPGVKEGDEEDEAADPSGVGLPLEDVEALRDFLRIDDAFLQEKDAAAVKHVHGAERFLIVFLVAAEIELEPSEEEGVADPHDGSHDVDHAEGDVEEFDHGGELEESYWKRKAGACCLVDSIERVGQFVGALRKAAFEVAGLVAEVGDDGVAFLGEFFADVGFENDGVEVGGGSATGSEDETFVGSHAFFGEVPRGGFAVRFGATGEEDHFVSQFDRELVKLLEGLDGFSFGGGDPGIPDFGLVAPVCFSHVRKIGEGGFVDIEDDGELLVWTLGPAGAEKGRGSLGGVGEVLLIKVGLAVFGNLLLEGGEVLGFMAGGRASEGRKAGEKENAFHGEGGE